MVADVFLSKKSLSALLPHDEGVFNDVYKGIYPSELQPKVEHSVTDATFVNVDIIVKDGVFVYKIFDKCDVFPFFILRMPYIDSNIHKSIFYSALVHEFIRIPRIFSSIQRL